MIDKEAKESLVELEPMNQEYKEKWVEALRSGKYEQCQGNLRKDNKYCCLGVLADIIEPALWKLLQNPLDDKLFYGYFEHDESSGYLSPEVQDKAGLQLNAMTLLADLNDTGYPFSSIADCIEENL